MVKATQKQSGHLRKQVTEAKKAVSHNKLVVTLYTFGQGAIESGLLGTHLVGTGVRDKGLVGVHMDAWHIMVPL